MWRTDKPEEHTSIFARFKGTSKWMSGMFEKCSDKVLVTVEFPDKSRKVIPANTCDGEWRGLPEAIETKVISWQSFPEPDTNNYVEE